jgi:hypothetical protein
MPVWRGAASGALTGVKKNAVILRRVAGSWIAASGLLMLGWSLQGS